MTTLTKTNLSTPLKVHCAANAIACQVKHGAATDLSDAFGISRPTFYKLRETAEQVLTEHFDTPANPRIELSEQLIKRTIVALRAIAPNSIRAIEDLLPIIYPGFKMSYGSIWKVCHDAEITATLRNKMEDLTSIKHVALDELYSQGSPVLGGVDLDSGYIFSLSLRESRGSADWCEVLNEAKEKGLDVDISVQDAASGISNSLGKVFPEAEKRDDCFHVLYIISNITSGLEAKAYRKIREEQLLKDKLKEAGFDQLTKRQSISKRLASLKVKVAAAINKYDYFNRALELVKSAFDFCSPYSLKLRTEEYAIKALKEAVIIIEHTDYWDKRKIASYLKNRIDGLLLTTKFCRERLEALYDSYGEKEVNLASALVWFHQRMQATDQRISRNNLFEHFSAAYQILKATLGISKTKDLIQDVVQVLKTRYRASSAIESVNSSLRPYLYCRKSVSQSYLELYRFYYNRKTRRWGDRKGSSAFEEMTGVKISDWLSSLGYTLH